MLLIMLSSNGIMLSRAAVDALTADMRSHATILSIDCSQFCKFNLQIVCHILVFSNFSKRYSEFTAFSLFAMLL